MERESSGVSDSTQLSSHPCNDCKSLRKKCDRTLPSCSRCIKRRYPCVYRTLAAVSSPVPNSSALARTFSPISSATHSPSATAHTDSHLAHQVKVLSDRLTAMENKFGVLLDAQQLHASQETPSPAQVFEQVFGQQLEDPDLLPSMGDWVIVYQYLRDEETAESSAYLFIEKQSFLSTFFSQPPALRLTFCAIASHLQEPLLPPKVTQEFYRRAQKAIQRCFHKPDFKTLQALLLLSSFALSNGQPMIGRPFFLRAVGMCLELGMNVDPDDAPWLEGLGTDVKNERRLVYWIVYYSYKFVQIAILRPLDFSLAGNVKFSLRHPSRLRYFGVSPDIPSSISPLCFVSRILDLIHEITMHHTTTPSSTFEIISCETCASIQTRLEDLRAQIPNHLITSLRDGSLSTLLTSGKARFQIADTVNATLIYNAAICLLHRPKLYLTAYLNLDSPELLDNAQAISTLLNSLDASLAAAQSIVQCVSLLVHTDDVVKCRRLWKSDPFLAFALFEAVLCLWFAMCRTRMFWFRNQEPNGMSATAAPGVLLDPLCMGLEDRRLMRSQCLDVVTTLKGLEHVLSGSEAPGRNAQEGGVTNMITPLLTGVFAMIQEMEDVEMNLLLGLADGGAFGSNNESRKDVEVAVIGMKVMSIGEEKPQEMDVETGKEPWCFLGLLGVAVGKEGLRWNAFYEQDWRNFWELVT
ncbi:hypothetical protein BJ741DRAFT_627014 [Chytriomyces cf. hyalinus JEL632]|nr:hypothetical protein BJ741DRAFT_627014 [Chytriomyces cf. hyalinus JEL632]